MTRSIILALAIAIGLAAPASASREQLERSARMSLFEFGFHDVDVTTLTTAQLSAIVSIAYSKRRGQSGKTALIRSTLGELGRLRGLYGLNR